MGTNLCNWTCKHILWKFEASRFICRGLTMLDVVYSIKISLRKISTQCLKIKINIFIVQNTALFILLCSAPTKCWTFIEHIYRRHSTSLLRNIGYLQSLSVKQIRVQFLCHFHGPEGPCLVMSLHGIIRRTCNRDFQVWVGRVTRFSEYLACSYA